ncbi:hypothetical protein T492DRAFT_1148905 [Pavlovales sp. CCMP2436]|nr:hypothetical protein T492DRAFT_1148905 [Pavlovales sp. CCMP2436]
MLSLLSLSLLGASPAPDCNGERYCGHECQRADWRAHKGICAQRAADALEAEEGEEEEEVEEEGGEEEETIQAVTPTSGVGEDDVRTHPIEEPRRSKDHKRRVLAMADGGTLSTSTLSDVLREVELPNTLVDMCRLVRAGAHALGRGARVHVCFAPPGKRGANATTGDDIKWALGTVVKSGCAPYHWTPKAR